MASTIAALGHEFVAVSKLLDVGAYRDAVGLNNHGVALLQGGDYNSAARLFKQASQKMMHAMHDESSLAESGCIRLCDYEPAHQSDPTNGTRINQNHAI